MAGKVNQIQKTQARPSANRQSLKLLTLSLTALSFLTPFIFSSFSHAQSASLPMSTQGQFQQAVPQLIKVKIPSLDESGITAEVHIPPAQAKDLVENSPAALRKKSQALRNHIAKMCAGRPGMIGQVIQEFPAEVAAFYTGLAVAAQHEIEKDPAAVKHFAEQNLTDPLAHVSFAFFMLGNRATTSALGFMGWNFDPCRHIKPKGVSFNSKIDPLTGNFDYDVDIKPTKLQRAIAPLIGPVGMAGGFLLSSVVYEVLADPNIRQCATGLTRKLNEEQLRARDSACDEAYKHWVTTRKIMAYVPDILAMSATSLVQAYVINYGASKALAAGRHALKGPIAGLALKTAADGSRVLSLTLRSVLVLSGATPGGAVVRFGVAAAQAAIFITLNEFILPYIKFPWERRTQGKDITASINEIYSELDRLEKNKWTWVSKPRSSTCDYQPTPADYVDAWPVYMAMDDCGESARPGVLVKNLGEKYRKWREFVLSDAYMAHSNWSDYLVRFQNTYTNARAFYKDMLYAIAWKRTPGTQTSEIVEKLFNPAPFFGLNTNVPDRICSMLPPEREKFMTAARIAQEALQERISGKIKVSKYSPEKEMLAKVYDGLSVVSCERAFAANDADDNRIRRKLLEEGIATLSHALAMPWKYGDFNYSTEHDTYQRIAERSPFAAMALQIGKANPLSTGQLYLMEANNNPAIIDQQLKKEHPDGVGAGGRARTETMADYLLAQMVCGPEADPRQDLKLHHYEIKQKSTWETILGYVGLDFSTAARMRDPKTMVYAEYAYEDAVAPEPKLFNTFSGDKNVQQIARTWGIRADFRPPKIIETGGYDFCGQLPVNANPDKVFWDIHTAQFSVNGRKYVGFLDLVKNFVRPSVIGTSVDDFRFSQWWETNVDPHVIRVVELMKDDYMHILMKQFLPAFTRTDETTYNGRKFESGVSKSLAAEARFNLVLIGKSLPIQKATRGQNQKLAEVHRRYVSLFNEFVTRMKLHTDLFSDSSAAHKAVIEIEKTTLDEADRPRNLPRQPLIGPKDSRYRVAFEVNKIILNEILKELGALGEMSKAAGFAPTDIMNEVRESALVNLSALVTETDSYFNLIDTVRVPGLE